jgi:stearoyl-CoA desaturase (delta-9 desaturase)
VQKELLEAKKDAMLAQCDKHALLKQYQELEQAWQNQKQAWLALNARLLKAA